MSNGRFTGRRAAGGALAAALKRYSGRQDVVVLGLARGGVPVAAEVARILGAPLDVLVVRKFGAPGYPELGMGAIASGGVRVLNHAMIRGLGVSRVQFEEITAREQAELERREKEYRDGRAPVELAGRIVIIVDDGLATGASMYAAVAAARARRAGQVVVATPVASLEAIAQLRPEVDDIVTVLAPDPFYAVGVWYVSFAQTTDDEVRELLGTASGPRRRAVSILSQGAVLAGDLTLPEHAAAVVIFAHGSGSGRHSLRNRYVAQALNRGGFATLLLDLLTPEEDIEDQRTGKLRFDVALLARRLADATRWVRDQSMTAELPVMYFAASTGAAAALIAAAHDRSVAAVVSRGGRPDLAGAALARVRAPVLLIVGGRDDVVLEINRRAMRTLRAPVEIIVIPDATHLFEEPGALEEVAAAANEWLREQLGAPTVATSRA